MLKQIAIQSSGFMKRSMECTKRLQSWFSSKWIKAKTIEFNKPKQQPLGNFS